MNDLSQTLQTSPIHTWIGVVAVTKGLQDTTIEVIVPEFLPVLVGAIGATTSNQTVTTTDIDGNPVNNTVTTKTSITAYYYGNSTNRSYPPDVVAGEQVRVMQFADSDKYYWESMGRDDALRMTETYRVEVKNRKNFSDPVDDEHTYSLELDSKRNMHIRLLTSNGNGEAHTYVLLMDTKNSKVQLSDEIGNAVTIDSINSKVIVQNSSSAFMMLNGQDAVFAAPRDITIKAGRQLLINSPLITLQNNSGSGILSINSNAVAISANTDCVLTSPAIGLMGAVKIPNILTVNNLRSNVTSGSGVGDSYSPASITLSSGTGLIPSVTPDTTMPSDQRHATAWEQFNEAMTIVVNCFNSIQDKIGVPTNQSDITPLQSEAEMLNLTGV